MAVSESIFLDFNVPNPATWFYFSLLLAVALFFKFSRLLSVRNLDLGLLFLPVPGLLLLLDPNISSRWGFVWLLTSSAVLVGRCLFDLVLMRRPALSPNLSPGGLAWLAGALFVSLIAIADRQPSDRSGSERKKPPVLERIQREGQNLLEQQTDLGDSARWVERALAIVCHLGIVAGLVFIGWRHFHDLHAGMAAATFYLLLPYTFLLMPYASPLAGQWHHIWPTALIIWAIAVFRYPTLAGLLLGIAAGSVGFPILVLPVWFSFYWGRGAGRFAGSFLLGIGICLGWLGVYALFRGESLANVWPAEVRDWLPWVSPAHDKLSVWTGMHWAYRIPVFVLYLALLIASIFWPAQKDLAHVIALCAALLIGTELWYADRGGAHVLWYLPLLLLLAFRPNLSLSQPLPIVAETDWLTHLRRWLVQLVQRLLGKSQAPVTLKS
jgi:hypothetical protein